MVVEKELLKYELELDYTLVEIYGNHVNTLQRLDAITQYVEKQEKAKAKGAPKSKAKSITVGMAAPKLDSATIASAAKKRKGASSAASSSGAAASSSASSSAGVAPIAKAPKSGKLSCVTSWG